MTGKRARKAHAARLKKQAIKRELRSRPVPHATPFDHWAHIKSSPNQVFTDGAWVSMLMMMAMRGRKEKRK